MHKRIPRIALLTLTIFGACSHTGRPAPHATASPDPCKRTSKAQVICGVANFYKAKTFTTTLDGGLTFHGVITMVRPSAFSYRFSNPSRGGEVSGEGVIIGAKAWILMDSYDALRVRWVKGRVPSGFMEQIARWGAVFTLHDLQHNSAPFIDRGNVSLGHLVLRRYNIFVHGISYVVDIDTSKNMLRRVLVPGEIITYSNINERLTITAPSTFGHPTSY